MADRSRTDGFRQSRMLGMVAVVTIALGSAALAHWLGRLSFLRSVDNQTYDLCFRLTPRISENLAPRHKPAPITLVWIDRLTADLLNKPRMLWPAEFAEVLRAAAAGGATKIGLDHFFEYPVTGWDEAADLIFLQAYTELTVRHIPVILAGHSLQPPRAGDKVPVYSQAAADHNTADPHLTLTSHEDSVGRGFS